MTKYSLKSKFLATSLALTLITSVNISNVSAVEIKANELNKQNIVKNILKGSASNKFIALSGKQKTIPKVLYKPGVTALGDKYASVCINNSEVLRFSNAIGSVTAEQRAKILVNRLDKFLKSGGNPNDIKPVIEGFYGVGKIKNNVLFVADFAIAKEMNISTKELAVLWVNNIRKALGAKEVANIMPAGSIAVKQTVKAVNSAKITQKAITEKVAKLSTKSNNLQSKKANIKNLANKSNSELATKKNIVKIACVTPKALNNQVSEVKSNEVEQVFTQDLAKNIQSCSKTPKIYCKTDKNGSAAVYVGNTEVINFNKSVSGISNQERAKVLAGRLDKFISKGGNPKDILPGIEKGVGVGRVKNEVLFTADFSIAKSKNVNTKELAIIWVNSIRKALGAPEITRTFNKIASRGFVSPAFSKKYLGIQENGLASWYGGRFNGRRAADGSVFYTHEMTAAHKTLPFGSLVKVTNKRNKRSCVVKITDRGPFVSGRIIDLSRAAAKNLEMIGNGISNVTIEVIGKFD